MTTDLPALPDDLRPVLQAFLDAHSTLALATAGDQDGRPQVAPLFFASDEDFNLYWISSPDSRHSTNLADWDVAEAAVFTQTWEWTGIKGVQFAGTATTVTGDEERDRALRLYRDKFPFVNERFEDVIANSVLYVLRPTWLRWLDNERHFGYKQEFSLGPPEQPQNHR